MARRPKAGEPFFQYFSLFLLLLALVGLGGRAAFDYTNDSQPPLPVVAHAIFMLTWYALVAFQATLIRGHNMIRHKRFGVLSLAVAGGLIYTGAYAAGRHFLIHEDPYAVLASAQTVVSFAILYLLGFIGRRVPRAHKRFMIYASISVLPPALIGLLASMGLSGLFVLPLWILMILVPVLYDWRKNKTVYASTSISAAFLIVGLIVAVTVGLNPAWAHYLESIRA
ncbi:hypothetical protein WNY37_05935 [Henriciella sp. AS95]|uniref:hypothetical protein n=1 Tax=Henriciella sp. AS95 TaxID=3135782 RepID=UPI0031805F8C